jgi:hypothetical protein
MQVRTKSLHTGKRDNQQTSQSYDPEKISTDTVDDGIVLQRQHLTCGNVHR